MKKIIVIYFVSFSAGLSYASENNKFEHSPTPPTHVAHWAHLVDHLREKQKDKSSDIELQLPKRKGPAISHEEKDSKKQSS